MSTLYATTLNAPGVAALTFQSLQRGSRFQDVLASLRAVQTVHSLPKCTWSVDSRHGITGTVRGADDVIAKSVWAWADAFAVKAVIEPAHMDAWQSGRTFLVSGFAVVQLLDGVTIGGRLIDPEAGR
jgi:hypothetical protein